jgi:hypothetical protein
MAERERRLAGVRDFRLRSDWDEMLAGDEKERFFSAGDENPVDGQTRDVRVDPLAAHLKPVPLVGEHVRSWAF